MSKEPSNIHWPGIIITALVCVYMLASGDGIGDGRSPLDSGIGEAVAGFFDGGGGQ